MSLITRISELTARVATEFKSVKSIISGTSTGSLTGLTTSVKTNIVAAINSLKTLVDTKQDKLGYTAENAANKGSANGYAPLDENAKVPATHLPSYVDDLEEYANVAAFPGIGSSDKIYVALDNNLIYRWSGSGYVEISKSLALGTSSSTAHRGDHGVTAYTHSQATGNLHGTTFEQLAAKPTTIGGFNITDAYTKTEIGDIANNFVTEFESSL